MKSGFSLDKGGQAMMFFNLDNYSFPPNSPSMPLYNSVPLLLEVSCALPSMKAANRVGRRPPNLQTAALSVSQRSTGTGRGMSARNTSILPAGPAASRVTNASITTTSAHMHAFGSVSRIW